MSDDTVLATTIWRSGSFSLLLVILLTSPHLIIVNTEWQVTRKKYLIMMSNSAKGGDFVLQLTRVQTLTPVWPETLMRSHRLSCALIEFEPAETVLESCREFSLVWPTLIRVEKNSR